MSYVNLTKLANKRSDEKRSKRRRNALLGAGLALGGAYLGRNKLKALASKLGRGASDIDVPQSAQRQVSDVDVPEELYDIYFPQSLSFRDGLDPEKASRYVDVDGLDNIRSTNMAYGRPVATKSGQEFNLYDHIDTSGGMSLEELAGKETISVGGQRITGLTKEEAESILYSRNTLLQMDGGDRHPQFGLMVAKRLMKENPNIKVQQMPTRYGTDAALQGIMDSRYLDTFQGAL